MMKKRFVPIILLTAILTGSTPLYTSSAESRLAGDVNGDGKLSIADVVMCSRYVGEDTSVSLTVPANADINNDGNVDFKDVTAMLRAIARLPMDDNRTAFTSRNLMDGIAVQQPEIIPYSDAFLASQMDFSVKLLKECVEMDRKENDNLLISPTSAMYALAMTANGAKDDTLAQMEQVLGGGMDLGELNKYLSSFRCQTTQSGKFNMANGIWYRDQLNGIPFEPLTDFIRTNADYYSAGMYSAPFDRSTVEDMDEFVNINTHGMIPQLFGDNYEIPEMMMMYLVNCLVFESKWDVTYIESMQTVDRLFTCYDGSTILSTMMNSTEWTYLSDENACGFIKPYENGEFSFAALLPDEGVDVNDYVAGLTGEKLTNILKNRSHEEVFAALPKFSGDYQVDLNDSLKNMGISAAFDANANFDGIDGGLFGLYISSVAQKTHIDVDTEGTKAAAVTNISMAAGSMYDPERVEPKTVILDRPFVYMILDDTTDLPLFIGTMGKPTPVENS